MKTIQSLNEELNVLIVEDNPGDCYLVEQMLRSSRVTRIKNIHFATRTSDACNILMNYEISLVLLDLSLPDSFGINSFLKIKRLAQKIPVIILTGHAGSEIALKAIQQGAQDYLVKGEFETDTLIKSIQYSIERKYAEEKLIELEKELVKQQIIKQQQITEAVLTAQETERKGIAQELHDNINQILATSKMYLSMTLGKVNPDMLMLLKSEKYISLAMEEIRKLSRALITPSFIEFGLKRAIQELVDIFEATSNIKVHIEILLPDDASLCEGLKIALYRITQEQLNNILKHANASSISIGLCTDPGTITLSIYDDGKGFDIRSFRRGIGITNMNNRAGLYNGTVEIDSSPGNGCRLKVVFNTKIELPLRAA